MPLCHSPRSFVSKVVSNRRSLAIGEEKISRTTTRGKKKKGKFEKEVHKKQKTFKP